LKYYRKMTFPGSENQNNPSKSFVGRRKSGKKEGRREPVAMTGLEKKLPTRATLKVHNRDRARGRAVWGKKKINIVLKVRLKKTTTKKGRTYQKITLNLEDQEMKPWTNPLEISQTQGERTVDLGQQIKGWGARPCE